ncbi:MAG TPA: hypothetical protein VM123_17405 [archaeon]|nr:hypothetical protein [archaeon]
MGENKSQLQNPPRGHNPHVDSFLTIYSQSDRSTGGTRGYDPETYVETKLDRNLIPRIFSPQTKLVILTGNAGDGKTAFIERVESLAEDRGGEITKRTDNGCTFDLNGVTYQTLYDGSQDFEGTANDAVLAAFFQELEGDKHPEGSFTKIIAINEGKLRDFILHKSQYRWLGKQVHYYLNYSSFKPHESLVFVNLNLRSILDTGGEDRSIFDLLLDRFLTPSFWEPCTPENCDDSDFCPIRYNVRYFSDSQRGRKIRCRLKHLLLAIHFRKMRHITMRDLRSILSLILFGKLSCSQIHSKLATRDLQINEFYYNAAFNGEEKDRIAQLLSDLDVARVSNPKLDNFIHFHSPDSPEVLDLFLPGERIYRADMPHLLALYENRPQGTQDVDPGRHLSAQLYHASMRRKLFFESDEEKMKTAGLPSWKDLLPYRQFDRFLQVIEAGKDSDGTLRDELTLAISKSERIYNEMVGREHLCLRTSGSKRTQTKSFYGFEASDFEVVVKDVGAQADFLEHLTNCLYYRHSDKTVELEIPLDLFEILCRIHDGYVPTASEIRTFFLNLEMFKRRVTTKRSDRVFLTEDDTNLFEIKSDPSAKLVMAKLGG